MIDEEIRRLERALAADPGDAVALEALAAARTRAGRGWADEPLPLDLRCSARERGVYVWTRHGLSLEMVRVPGAAGGEWVRGRGSARQVPVTEPALFLGRYPVTLGEWREFLREGRGIGRQTTTAWMLPHGGRAALDHPVVNVTHADAVAFCSWAGLRLPTAAEWTRAAGIDTSPQSCPDAHTGQFFGSKCPQCVGEPCVGPRPYPWGNEAPTPERCVGLTTAGELAVEILRTFGVTDELGPGTRPVRTPEGLPARPLGASPCGAMDMVGHVWEWQDSGAAQGGSFRSGPVTRGARSHRLDAGADDETGFRVTLSEPGAAP